MTPDLLEGFQRETNVHAGLRLPNVVLLYGIGMESTRCAMVLEFMANGSLFDVLKGPAELPWSVRVSMVLDLAQGLSYLHGRHIVHRDLKSLNILVDGQMRAKLSDFGLSKIKLTTASMTRGGGGTIHWEAPELFDEAPNSYATDVYAAGIVLWEIAARRLPYEGKTKTQIMRFVDGGKREAIPEDAPPPFSALITRCWAQLAGDRPTMTDVARDMRSLSESTTMTTTSTVSQGPGPASPASTAAIAIDSGYAAFSRK